MTTSADEPPRPTPGPDIASGPATDVPPVLPEQPAAWHPTGWYSTPRPRAPRLRTAATLVQLAFGVLVIVHVGLAWAILSRYRLLGRIVADPNSVTLPEADASDHRVQLWAIAYLVVNLMLIVAWLVWFYRARLAAEAYSDDLRFGTGWAIGAWFVPFLNLVRPLKMTFDIHDAVSGNEPSGDTAHRRGNALIGWWWAMVLLSGVLIQISIRVGGDSAGSLRHAAIWDVVGGALNVVAALLAVAVVQRITSASDARRDAGATSSAG